MTNQLTDVMKHYSEQTAESSKRLKALNLNLYEQLSQKQADLVKVCVEMSTQQAVTLSKIYGFGNLILANQEMANEFSQRWMNTVREAADIWHSVHSEWWSIVEETADYTQSAATQALEAGKQLADETIEAAKANHHASGAGQTPSPANEGKSAHLTSAEKDKAPKHIPKAA